MGSSRSARKAYPLERDAQGLPVPLRWRPAFSWLGLLFGAVFDLGIEVTLQQAGVAPLTVWTLARAAGFGILIGVVVPSTGRAVGIRIVNRKIHRMRRRAKDARRAAR